MSIFLKFLKRGINNFYFSNKWSFRIIKSFLMIDMDPPPPSPPATFCFIYIGVFIALAFCLEMNINQTIY